MRYVALLRGINVGGNRKVEMKRLKSLFESYGYVKVSTYINSGNIIFESEDDRKSIQGKIKAGLEKEFGFDIPALVKTESEMKEIAHAIPTEWKNDSSQKSDVAFLFPEIDSRETIEELPINKEFINIRYVRGAIFWNVDRKNYNKSYLNKIVDHKHYQFMTVRNVNTARHLAEAKK